MSLEPVLERMGLSASRIDALLADEWFHVRDEAVLQQNMDDAARVYGCSYTVLGEIIASCPQFAGYDHSRVVREAVREYG